MVSQGLFHLKHQILHQKTHHASIVLLDDIVYDIGKRCDYGNKDYPIYCDFAA